MTELDLLTTISNAHPGPLLFVIPTIAGVRSRVWMTLLHRAL
jgi:hypothetical protein